MRNNPLLSLSCPLLYLCSTFCKLNSHLSLIKVDPSQAKQVDMQQVESQRMHAPTIKGRGSCSWLTAVPFPKLPGSGRHDHVLGHDWGTGSAA